MKNLIILSIFLFLTVGCKSETCKVEETPAVEEKVIEEVTE